jgi:hypothetical protein
MTPKSIALAVAAVGAVYPYAQAFGDGPNLNFYFDHGSPEDIPCASLNLRTGALTMVPPDTVYTTTYPAAGKIEEE